MKCKWVPKTSARHLYPSEGRTSRLDHLAMYVSDNKHLGPQEPVSETAKVEWLKEKQWLTWIPFTPVSTVSFTWKAEAVTFLRISEGRSVRMSGDRRRKHSRLYLKRMFLMWKSFLKNPTHPDSPRHTVSSSENSSSCLEGVIIFQWFGAWTLKPAIYILAKWLYANYQNFLRPICTAKTITEILKTTLDPLSHSFCLHGKSSGVKDLSACLCSLYWLAI